MMRFQGEIGPACHLSFPLKHAFECFNRGRESRGSRLLPIGDGPSPEHCICLQLRRLRHAKTVPVPSITPP